MGVATQEEQGAMGSGAALESASTGATSAAAELERALVEAARDQARDLAPLADDARRLASDLAHIGTITTYLLIAIPTQWVNSRTAAANLHRSATAD